MKKIKFSIAISTLIITFSCFSIESDYEQPIHVSSVSQHAKMKENTVVFIDNVILTQGTIKITADKLTVIRGEKANQEIMIAEGNLATFYQTQDDGKPFDAQANTIRYDLAESTITLQDNAQVKQLDSEVNGEKIVYSINNEELTVSTGQAATDRVNTVFLPAQFENKNTSTSDDKTIEKEE
ncbi:lipopolysaccharide transport periplasmic protein LptA [Psychromonas sp. MME2]|uniref:lipopolysaccharide transport periplasmic protein LptA n=1 Tax=unclassified Psychromonas TaxID=2614957 RepID=UPI00339BE90F